MIALTGVSKSYNRGTVKAVDDLSLTTKAGEIFGFLGPNGAGKTTTIKMMVGLLKKDQGMIRINGKDIDKEPLEVKKAISYVPDTPEVYDRLTGVEYLNFMADVYQISAHDRKEKIHHLLSIFELTNAVGNLIQSYSHGMKQKIVLIGAMLNDPDVFILDEPMVGLDPRSSNHLKNYMREHCNQGKSVFFSTHVLEVAEKICDRIGIIRNGKLIACGTMDDLRSQAEKKESLVNIFLEMTES